MKYALIGCGRISPNHIAAAKNNGLEIVALCDVVVKKASTLANADPLDKSPKIYSDYKTMLRENRIDLVAIATESGKHASVALDCIDAGCNVIVEKPIALSIDDADAIIRKSAVKDVIVSACHQNRFNPAIGKIHEALQLGRFGRLFYATAHVRWSRGRDYYDQARWRGTWEQDGGALMNQCIHSIDLLRWLMGADIDEVFAYTANLNHNYIEAEDLGLAVMRFKNGSHAIIEGTTNVFPENLEETLCIFGENGTVKAGGKSVNTIEEWRFADDLDHSDEVKRLFSEDPPDVYGFGHTPLYADVVNAIRNKRIPFVTADDGKRALELVLAIYKSAVSKKPIKFPLNGGSSLEFARKAWI